MPSYGGWYPQIFGAYEYKVQEWLVDRLGESPSPTFWDIGAAEGFYAIGGAMNNAKVVAWEGERPQRETIRAVASANGVAASIELRGYCTPEELLSSVEKDGAPSIVLMDTEGFETELISKALLERCRQTAFLIELHGESAIQHVCETFAAAGFTGELFDHEEWGVARWPHFRFLPNRIKEALLKERRAPLGNPYYSLVPGQ